MYVLSNFNNVVIVSPRSMIFLLSVLFLVCLFVCLLVGWLAGWWADVRCAFFCSCSHFISFVLVDLSV